MGELVVEFCTLQGSEGEGAWAGGVVVTDVRSARAVHASGHVLGDVESEEESSYRLLLRALELIEPLEPTDVELRCGSARLVEQLTGGGTVTGGPRVEPLFERAIVVLLRLGLWRIRSLDAEELVRSIELAEAALARGGDVVKLSAEQGGRQEGAGLDAGAAGACSAGGAVVRWTVEFAEDAGPRCPAKARGGDRYGFGPDTPGGFCVHAMSAVVEDGPLAWSDPEQRRMTTVCPHCDVPMDIERLDT